MRFLLVLLSTVVVACSGGVGEESAVDPLAGSGTVTELSQQASELSIGMTKTEVLALLDQPSWAVTSDDASDLAEPDVPLTLIWRNGNCNPVMVNFDSAGAVTGKDEGRALCGDEEYTFLPEDEFACPRAACQ